MKRKFVFLSILCIGTTYLSQAQGGAIGAHATINKSDADLNGNEHHFYEFKFMQPGAAISLRQYLNPSFNLVEKISFNQTRYQNDLRSEDVDADFYVVKLKLKHKSNTDDIFKEDGVIGPEVKVKDEVKMRPTFASGEISFETGKTVLRAASYPMLNEIVSILGEYKDYKLKIDGHTDSNGSNDTNLTLSQARVDAVKAYLINKGAEENRIEAAGYGEVRPVATNGTPAGRAQNRRVGLELVLK